MFKTNNNKFVMERTIKVRRPNSIVLDLIQTEAKTLKELKEVLESKMTLNTEDLHFVIRETLNTLELDDAELPEGDFTLLLFKKTQKGGINYSKLSYKEIANIAKDLGIKTGGISRDNLIDAIRRSKRNSRRKAARSNVKADGNVTEQPPITEHVNDFNLYLNDIIAETENIISIAKTLEMKLRKLNLMVKQVVLLSKSEFETLESKIINEDYKKVKDQLENLI